MTPQAYQERDTLTSSSEVIAISQCNGLVIERRILRGSKSRRRELMKFMVT
jgi:hypothetical protein